MASHEDFTQRADGLWQRTDGIGRALYREIVCEACGKPALARKDRATARFCSRTCNQSRHVDDPGYWAQHTRVRRARGAAKHQQCVFAGDNCTKRMDWAWNNITTMDDPDSFFPACMSHHHLFDDAVADRNPDHGTHQMYWRYGCHCEVCMQGNRDRTSQQKGRNANATHSA